VILMTGMHNDGWVVASHQYCIEPGHVAEGPPRRPSPLRRVATWRLLEQAVARAARRPEGHRRDCAWLAQGFHAVFNGEPPVARRWFERTTEQQGGDWRRVGLGLVALQEGDLGPAVEQLESIAGPLVELPAFGVLLAWTLRGVGRRDAARRRLPKQSRGELPVYVDLVDAWLLRDDGDLDRAVDRFATVVTVAPPHTESGLRAREALGWLALERGDWEDGRQRLEEVRGLAERTEAVKGDRVGWTDLGLALAALHRGDEQEGEALLALASDDSTTAPTVEEVRRLRAQGRLELPQAMAGLRPMPWIEPPGWAAAGDQSLLLGDLERAWELAEGRRIGLAVATYPWPGRQREHRRTVERFVAAHPGVALVDFEAATRDALTAGARWDELFIPDSHPTTEGYRVLGIAAAEALQPMLADRGTP
jgi:tetratricopeptide (TPR) repeat protein